MMCALKCHVALNCFASKSFDVKMILLIEIKIV